MRDPRLIKLAEVLVNYSIGVKKDQLVRLSGPSIGEPLIVELYRAVLKAGGQPLVRMSPDELGYLMLKDGADHQLQYVSRVALYEIEKIDCSIGIWADENTKSLTNCDSKKMG